MVLVIFYVISLHTVANHSDDHCHTAVNIINVLYVKTPHTCTVYEDVGAELQ